MSVAIVGGKGNMGRRYASILKELGIDHWSIDYDNFSQKEELCLRADSILIATPTSKHAEHIFEYAKYSKPILCEKPITTNLNELEEIGKVLEKYSTPFKMVMQYEFLPGFYPDSREEIRNDSYYNYFNHGKDGLKWDCIQIIALAKGSVALFDDSPVWKCRINGQKLKIKQMDYAYIAMVKEWNESPFGDFNKIFAIHEKVENFKCPK